MASQASIRKSLMLQIKNKGANVDHFNDLIDDYVQFFKIKKALQADINKRGVSFKTWSASGNKIEKNNPSVKELVAVNKQMLMILDKLDLNTKNTIREGDRDAGL